MEFVDRVSAYPNRYVITDENGNTSHVYLERADEPTVPGTPLSAETFNGMRNEIDAEIAGKAPAGYGLGGVAQYLRGADLNDILSNGWYSWGFDCINTPFVSGSMLVIVRGEGTEPVYAFQIAFYDGTYDIVVKIRKKTLGTWGEWKDWSPSAFAPAGYVAPATVE